METFWLTVAFIGFVWWALAGVAYYRRQVRIERVRSMARHPAGKGRV